MSIKAGESEMGLAVGVEKLAGAGLLAGGANITGKVDVAGNLEVWNSNFIVRGADGLAKMIQYRLWDTQVKAFAQVVQNNQGRPGKMVADRDAQ